MPAATGRGQPRSLEPWAAAHALLRGDFDAEAQADESRMAAAATTFGADFRAESEQGAWINVKTLNPLLRKVLGQRRRGVRTLQQLA